MTPGFFASGVADISNRPQSDQIEGWMNSRRGTALDVELGGRVPNLVAKLSEKELQTVCLMMRASAESALFYLLCNLDGVSDFDTAPNGMFEVSFKPFKKAGLGGLARQKIYEIVPTNSDMLHDLFSEACAKGHEKDGLGQLKE